MRTDHRTTTLADYLDSKCAPEPNTGCWLWTGGKTTAGYAIFNRLGGVQYGHRASYECFNGPIPAGLDLDHKCRTRACINPAHLEPVTRRENVVRGIGPAMLKARHDARTHCKRGHEFTQENTRSYAKNGMVTRQCKACQRLHREARAA